MESVNRAAVVIKPKQPFIDWLNSIPDENINFTLDQILEDNLIFLIPEHDDPEDSKNYIRERFDQIFDWELFGWITTEELWPKKRTWKMFQEWFDIEINSEVFDLVNGEIEKEEM
ncbi:MAG: hypothetical protein ACYTEU_03490 [Planctomycetota bacterium]|jgi:hypothetical protein